MNFNKDRSTNFNKYNEFNCNNAQGGIIKTSETTKSRTDQ